MGVCVMGVGISGIAPTSTGVSYREMIKSAAEAAYQDAGIEAEDLDGAVSIEEDFISGYSIADEYVPDQLAVVRKPVYTICGDFLQGLASAVMQIQTGRFKRVVVESYSKASNVLEKDELLSFAYDPVFERLGVSPHYLAGVEMQRFLDMSMHTMGDVAEVVSRNRARAIANPLAPYGARISPADVLASRPVATPVTEPMIARHSDVAVCFVLGTDETVETCKNKPIWISGTGWASGNSIVARRNHGVSVGSVLAGRMAYAEAGIELPHEELDVYYVNDLYAHRQLMHMDALGLTDDQLPVINPNGGILGMGDTFESNSGVALYDAILQLRGHAGAHQVAGARRALVHGWRGLPTDTAAVTILDAEGR